MLSEAAYDLHDRGVPDKPRAKWNRGGLGWVNLFVPQTSHSLADARFRRVLSSEAAAVV